MFWGPEGKKAAFFDLFRYSNDTTKRFHWFHQCSLLKVTSTRYSGHFDHCTKRPQVPALGHCRSTVIVSAGDTWRYQLAIQDRIILWYTIASLCETSAFRQVIQPDYKSTLPVWKNHSVSIYFHNATIHTTLLSYDWDHTSSFSSYIVGRDQAGISVSNSATDSSHIVGRDPVLSETQWRSKSYTLKLFSLNCFLVLFLVLYTK